MRKFILLLGVAGELAGQTFRAFAGEGVSAMVRLCNPASCLNRGINRTRTKRRPSAWSPTDFSPEAHSSTVYPTLGLDAYSPRDDALPEERARPREHC